MTRQELENKVIAAYENLPAEKRQVLFNSLVASLPSDHLILTQTMIKMFMPEAEVRS